MAGFSFAKPKPVAVGANEVPTFKTLPMQDKLLMLGAALKGDTQGMMAIPMLAAARQKQAQQQALDNEFARYLSGEGVPMLTRVDRPAIPDQEDPATGLPMKRTGVNVDIPQFGVIPGESRQGPPTLRDALPLLMRRRAAGMDIKTDIDLLDKAGPKSVVVNGRVLDERDPGAYGKYYGDAPAKGAEPVYDRNGREVGWRMANGAIKAISEASEADQLGKTRGGIMNVPMLDGTEVPMTAGEYLDTRAGRGVRPAPSGFGVKPSEAQTALSTGRAENQAKQEGMVGEAATQAQIDLPKVIAQAEEARGLIDKIRKHPKLDRRTGMSAIVPAITGEDVDFDALVDQVRGGVFLQAFERLKGGGQITEIEGRKATDAIARLNQRQSKGGFLAALKDLTDVIDIGLQRAQSRAQGGATTAQSAGGTAGITAAQARAELERRRAARGGQ